MYDKRIGQEFTLDPLGEEWKGYIVRITGGNDKQGFPMMQGVLTTSRVRLLLKAGHSGYRPRREGERKRKSVRGCIVDQTISVLNLVIIKKGMIITCVTLFLTNMTLTIFCLDFCRRRRDGRIDRHDSPSKTGT